MFYTRTQNFLDSPLPLRFHNTVYCITAAEPQRARFFTGNNAVDSGAAGAALGVGTQYFLNQFLNPCARVSVNPTSTNRNTNKRILGSNPTVTNGALGFLAGFATASLAHQAAGSPCGR